LPVIPGAIVTMILRGAAAVAGPWEDGMVVYNRGDYLPPTIAIASIDRRTFHPAR
jgi:hypothetical protein